MASTTSLIGGVAKKIALFEFVPPDNNNTTSTHPRLRRKDAIKRKKLKNSHLTSPPPSPMSSPTLATPEYDLETQSKNYFKSTKTLWLSSGYSASGESSVESFSGPYNTTTSTTNPISKGIIKTTTTTNNNNNRNSTTNNNYKYPYPSSTTTTSSSDDYELSDFNTITRRMNENMALVDELIKNKYNRQRSEVVGNNKFGSEDWTRGSTRSLKDCYQSFTLPIGLGRKGNLKLVEFTDSQLNSPEEPYYEELDDYSKDDGNIMMANTTTTSSITISNNNLQSAKKDELSMSSTSQLSEKDEESGPGRFLPPTPPPYESLYSELIYDGQIQNNNKWTSSTDSSSYLTPSSSLYNRSTASTTTTTTPPDNIYLNNMEQSKHKNPIVTGLNSQGASLPFYYKNNEQLPPIPTTTNTNGLSQSIAAKLAGNKFSKKFKFLRKLSKSSLDYSELCPSQNLSMPSVVVPGAGDMEDKRRNSSPNMTGVLNENLNMKKPLIIIRPNIPPPEPPRNPPRNMNMNSKENLNLSKSSLVVPLLQSGSRSEEDHGNNDDDSDFYDSDSELIRNFVAAVQPIYSMEEEPLYQYYTYGISLQPEDNYQPVIPKNLGLTLDMLIPRTGQRTLWCEIPEVVSSGILSILSDQQKKLQEAIFEVLTSEVSYLKSLDVLISLFYDNDILVQVLTKEDRNILFGNITSVKECSQSFLSELLNKWEESWYIQEVGEIINNYAKNKFQVYKEYCRNKPYQDKILQKLRNSNDEFVNIIKSLEEDPKCQMLRMDSFLMLPMQRVTRLPLLVNAIIQRTHSTKEKGFCENALKNLTNLVLECNDSARESQDAEETAAIFEKIEFPKNVSSITYPGQFLLKGDFIRNPTEQQGVRNSKMNWSFQKKKQTLYWLILFTNQLFLTRKRSSGKFEVIDMVSPSDASIKPLPNYDGSSKEFQRFFLLHFNKTEISYFLAARTQSEVDRWKQKLDQLKAHKDLKVEAIFLYDAKREDELSFMVGDIIQVSQIQPDGWYFGRKMDTEDTGWFPGNYCAEC